MPGTRTNVTHGSSSPSVSGADSALQDAYRLSGLVMWLAFKRTVNGA